MICLPLVSVDFTIVAQTEAVTLITSAPTEKPDCLTSTLILFAMLLNGVFQYYFSLGTHTLRDISICDHS